jgi:hypothetical protein
MPHPGDATPRSKWKKASVGQLFSRFPEKMDSRLSSAAAVPEKS